MIRKFFIAISVLFFSAVTFAADMIKLIDGNEIWARVIKVTSNSVEYRNASNARVWPKSIDLKKVLYIKYEDEHKDILSSGKDNADILSSMQEEISDTLLYPADMSYKELLNLSFAEKKERYSDYQYVTSPEDKYNPGFSGFLSLIIPGAGQVYSGETKRGITMFCTDIAFIFSYCVITGISSNARNESAPNALSIILGGTVFAYNIYIFADACRVAKINNMYNRELLEKSRKISLSLRPYYSPYNCGRKVDQVGVSFCIDY